MEAAIESAADFILKLVIDPVTENVKSMWNNEEEIENLAETIDHIRDVLSEVEGKQFKGYKRLRKAFLDAEDFLDKVRTLKEKKDLEARMIEQEKEEINKVNGKLKRSLEWVDNKLEPYKKKIRCFFSSSNQVKYALEVNNTIKNIRKKLDAISEDMQKFGPKVPSSSSEAIQMTARASGFNVNPTDIIGRDEDKRKIVDLLLRSSVDQKKIPVISIVAPGGMGKTAAAQLVYNDKSWQECFRFDERLWVSDSKKLDLKSLLKHILKSLCPKETGLDELEEDHLRQRIDHKIRGKRFLLVLDDVENEDRFKWENLKGLLDNGTVESRILVTTRSRTVAKVVGSSNSTHELSRLSKEDSLQLFESYAFREKRDESLVEIGNLIVKKCCGVPLAIKVVGSLLCGEGKRKWEYVRDNSLADIADEGKQIMNILKISYYNLDPTLKTCFSFCALFPKNYRISRETLSNIWMANDCFKTAKCETLEDACDKNLRILYNRCFLEASLFTYEKIPDEWGDVEYFKMHDLMYDLAKEVAGGEILVVDSDNLILEEDVRHVMLDYGASTFEHKGRRLRTFLQRDYGYGMNRMNRMNRMTLNVDKIVSECPVLRYLEMFDIKNLTNSIGELIHLRYLCLSDNEFQSLPDSITELINLEVLDISGCEKLEELPRGIEKLTKLKKLLLRGCRGLTHRPSGMGALTSLEVLDISDCEKLEELPRGIEKLMKLKKLLLSDCRGLTHLPSGMGLLTSLEVLDISRCSEKLEELPRGIEKLMKLKKLLLRGCMGLTHLPSGMGALTSLEVLDISCCEKLEELPRGIEKLMKLKKLLLRGCRGLTHLPSGMGALTSLEVLDISCCEKLEELPRGIEKLMKLKKLLLRGCRGLTHLPSGMGALTSLEVLDISDCEKLEELPRGIEKLMKLKKLLLGGCWSLAGMPSGMGALLGVCEPGRFIVGDRESKHTAQLEELGPLSDLPAKLKIELRSNTMRLRAGGDSDEAFLFNKKSLRQLEIRLESDNPEEEVPRNHMEILGKLQPPTSLEEFVLYGYQGMTFPAAWMPKDGFASVLPNLVSLSLLRCWGYRYLPPLSRFHCLGYLHLGNMKSLEYIEEENDSDAPFCLPQLESLTLYNLPELKGWRRGLTINQSLVLPSFPRLSRIIIGGCPKLRAATLHSVVKAVDISSSSFHLFAEEVCKNCSGGVVLSKEEEDSLTLKNEFFNATGTVSSSMAEAFRGMSHHLTRLEFSYCRGLKTLPGLQHLTALRQLEIEYCDDFTWEEEEEEDKLKSVEEVGDEISMESLNITTSPPSQLLWEGLRSLTELAFQGLPKMVRLPEGIQYVTSLQKIDIQGCENLIVPEWVRSTYECRPYSYSYRIDGFCWEKKSTRTDTTSLF